VEKSTNSEKKCGNCWYAVKKSPSNIAYWGFAYKYLECTATDNLNIYKDKDDICDKGKYRRRGAKMTNKQLEKWIKNQQKQAFKMKIQAIKDGDKEEQSRFWGMEIAFLGVLMALRDEFL